MSETKMILGANSVLFGEVIIHHFGNLFSIPLVLVGYERLKPYLKRRTRRDRPSTQATRQGVCRGHCPPA